MTVSFLLLCLTLFAPILPHSSILHYPIFGINPFLFTVRSAESSFGRRQPSISHLVFAWESVAKESTSNTQHRHVYCKQSFHCKASPHQHPTRTQDSLASLSTKASSNRSSSLTQQPLFLAPSFRVACYGSRRHQPRKHPSGSFR